MELKEVIDMAERVAEEAKSEIAGISNNSHLEEWRVKYLGRKGAVKGLFENLASINSAEEKREAGKSLNEIKVKLTKFYEEKKSGSFNAKQNTNLSFPGKPFVAGKLHPITNITREITDIFYKMGFGIVTGPDIETEYYNFEALNIPAEHPSRDIWDTFYINEKQHLLLRTHTSPVQARIMEKISPPLRIISVGRCFRKDAFDASHSPVFHQMEGLLVDSGVKFSHLKGVLTYFLTEMFGNNLKVKFLPSYFPFTEPSAEVSISCIICGSKGCSTCSGSGFLEILGCGMVHPEVFRKAGYSSGYSGFAFGMGVERLAMLKFGIKDIRYFYQNDIRFIQQFI